MSKPVEREFLPALHGLRGLMALWVVIHHTSEAGFGFAQIGMYGYFAVDVFFILSGYILMRNHARQFKQVSIEEVTTFLKLRWWRIYPIYLVSVILSSLVFQLLHDAWPEPGRILESLLILDVWEKPGIGVNGPVWSLGVEWIGYGAFPFIVFVLLRLNTICRLIVLAALPSMAIVYIAWKGGVWHHVSGYPALVRMATGFGAGCILSSLQSNAPNWLRERGNLLIALATIGMIAFLTLGLTLFVVPFLILLVYGAATCNGAAASLLGSRPALWLGRVSFALYITHYLVIVTFVQLAGRSETSFTRLVGTVCILAIALALSGTLCSVVEEPVRRWSRSGRKTGASVLHTSFTP